MTSAIAFAGPALSDIAPDDVDALAALAAEQRARLATIRHERIWAWLGGIPNYEVCRTALFGIIAFMLLVPATAITAGFTQGPTPWVMAALTVASVLPYWLCVWPARRQGLRLCWRGELRVAVAVAAEAEACDPHNERLRVLHALVGEPLGSPQQLQNLIADGDRLRAMLDGRMPVPSQLAAFVAAQQELLRKRQVDNSLIEAPLEFGPGRTYARLWLSPNLLPEECLTSRLLFLYIDPQRRGRHRARSVPAAVWGEGVGSLCAAFPWQVQP